MNYILFSILFSFICILIIVLLFLLGEKWQRDFGIPIIALIILTVIAIVGLLVAHDDIFKEPYCIEYKGKAPIEYIWKQDKKGVYVGEKPLLLVRYMHDYSNQIDIIDESYKDPKIPNIDSLEVYQYQYKPWLGFVTSLHENYILVLTHDRWVTSGICKERNIELKK